MANLITDDELNTLQTRHGNTLECQNAQAKLFAHGFHYAVCCGEVKPTSAFYATKRQTLGLTSHCRACTFYSHLTRKYRPVRSMPAPILFNQTQRTERFFTRFPIFRPKRHYGACVETRAARLAGDL